MPGRLFSFYEVACSQEIGSQIRPELASRKGQCLLPSEVTVTFPGTIVMPFLSSLSFWEGVEYAATAVVILGVIGEFIADFTKVSSDKEKSHRIAKLSTLILIGGLAFELIGLVRTSQLSGQTIARLNESAQKAEADAESARTLAKGFERDLADANARVKTAESTIALANGLARNAQLRITIAEERIARYKKQTSEADARAAEARSMAEQERLERIRLEAQIAPRRLSNEELDAITTTCRQFSGKVVTLVTYALDSEALILGRQIEGALMAAGLHVNPNFASLQPFGGFIQGIQISGPVSEQDLVSRLTVSLAKDGKLSVLQPRNLLEGQGQRNKEVVILIGVKPIN
jgi:hypothetical protein